MSAHTPGPWTREGQSVYALYHNGDYRDGKPVMTNRFSLYVSECQGGNARTGQRYGCSKEEAEANARLIAAAPALLEAAGNLIADVRRRYPGEDLMCPYMRALDEAVTAAKQDKGGE